MKNKILILFALLVLISSCSQGKRSQKADEFLIEKKRPLVMPPDMNKLPSPNDEEKIIENDDNDFKEIVTSSNSEKENLDSTNNGSLEDSIIKKIEQ